MTRDEYDKAINDCIKLRKTIEAIRARIVEDKTQLKFYFDLGDGRTALIHMRDRLRRQRKAEHGS